MHKKIRVLVVDDSAFMRRIIADILLKDSHMEVVGWARDGEEAVTRFKELNPDVVTLDVEMPKKSGIEALQEMMAIRPVPVVMVSALTSEGAEVTLKALSIGAVDFVTKPSGTISVDMERVADELCKKVIMASNVRMRGVAATRPVSAIKRPVPQTSAVSVPRHGRTEMVLIASSTGGPKALQDVIPLLPASFPVPVMVVQHMPAGFTTTFAQRLDSISNLNVVEGYEGLKVKKGMAVIAPGGYHMVVSRMMSEITCHLQDTPPVRSVKPAADVLFMNVAEVLSGGIVAAVLTGMGRDGTDGARAIKQRGGLVISESRDTCVVYGMPRSVEESGLSDEVLPLDKIAGALQRLVQ